MTASFSPRAEPAGDRVIALTSLSPAPGVRETQRACVHSWRAAGLDVRSFNHPSEFAALANYQVELVPVSRTLEGASGRPYVPITEMLRWAGERNAPVLILNADIQLVLAPWEMKRIRWITEGGLCYFVRHNHDGRLDRAALEPFGIDGFLLHGRHSQLFPESLLSMGQPFWDYWLPHTFAARRLPVWAVEFPVAFHRNHARRWSDEQWYRCALEFDRVMGGLGADRSMRACTKMAARVRSEFDAWRVALPARPPKLRDWVEKTLRRPGTKTILELGAHRGTDTAWMAALPAVTLHAFEPDPRNRVPHLPNVILNRAAISDRDGTCTFIMSRDHSGKEWTYSSSIRQPKNHLARYPVTFFDESIDIEAVTLDSYCQRNGLDEIDFIWADIQGAEGEMVRGGLQTLSRTRHLFTEYSDDELYEGQATLRDLLELLPTFRVIELWEDDVLLENTALSGPSKAP